jgi:Mitochondrial ribosomal death-associated protein 3
MFVPKGWDQVQSGWYIEPVRTRSAGRGASTSSSASAESDDADVELSEKRTEQLFDNPFMSAEVLRGFWKAHSEQLKKLPIKNKEALKKYGGFLEKFKENWTRARSMSGREKLSFIKVREIIEAEDNFPDQDELDADVLKSFEFSASFEPKTLEDLVRFGVAFRDYAGQAVIDVVAELRALDIPEMPVLIAVDQYNTWDGPSVYHYKDHRVMGRELCVPKALSFLTKKKAETEAWTMKNGICIAATSMRYPEGRKHKYEDFKNSIPLVLRVPCYSQLEMLSAVTYYTNQKRIGEGMSTQELLTFRMLSGSNPRHVRTESVPFFFPLSVGKHGMDFMKPIASEMKGAGAGADGADDETFDDIIGKSESAAVDDVSDIIDSVVAGGGAGANASAKASRRK